MPRFQIFVFQGAEMANFFKKCKTKFEFFEEKFKFYPVLNWQIFYHFYSITHSLYRGSCALSQFYSLCNFDATFLRGWSEARPRRYVFHSAKLPTIQMLFGGKFTTRNYPCIGYVFVFSYIFVLSLLTNVLKNNKTEYYSVQHALKAN